jgi:hypothetical protein
MGPSHYELLGTALSGFVRTSVGARALKKENKRKEEEK